MYIAIGNVLHSFHVIYIFDGSLVPYSFIDLNTEFTMNIRDHAEYIQIYVSFCL